MTTPTTPTTPRARIVWAAHLLGLVRDNPVLEKDASTSLRAPVAPFLVAAGGLVVWLAALAAHLTAEPSVESLAAWSGGEPSGRAMLAAAVGALLVLETLLLPTLASSAVAGERELGTLPLLQVSALTPARVVAGKAGAILVAAAPLLCAALPVLALASLYGGVGVVEEAAAVVVVVVHAAALACVGVGASSLVKRARTAAPLAMLFSLGPAAFLGIPAVITLALFVDGHPPVALMAPILVTGLACDVVLAVAALLLARDQLSPKSAPRWPLRRVVLGCALVGVPVVAALALHLSPALASDTELRDSVTFSVLLEAAVLMCWTVALEVCWSDARPVDGRAPLGQALRVSVLTAVGVAAARAIPDPAAFAVPGWHRAVALGALPWAGVVFVAAYVLFCAMLAAAVSRVIKRPALRMVVVVIAVVALFMVPLVLDELRWALDLPRYALGFTNPALLVDALPPGGRGAPLRYGLAFFATSSALFAFVARRPRTR